MKALAVDHSPDYDLDALLDDITKSGLKDSNLIIGVDYSERNLCCGELSFFGRCLHALAQNDTPDPNPYQLVIWTVCKMFTRFDEDKRIPMYGFQDDLLFPFLPNDRPCVGFEEVLATYTKVTKCVKLCGSANYSRLIDKTIEIVKETGKYHILLIIGTNKIDDPVLAYNTRKAIARASSYPISIIMIGVGDGPWNFLANLENSIPDQNFHNFHYVAYDAQIMGAKFPPMELTRQALLHLPQQYKCIRTLDLLESLQQSKSEGPDPTLLSPVPFTDRLLSEQS